jgi:hypothetical protein
VANNAIVSSRSSIWLTTVVLFLLVPLFEILVYLSKGDFLPRIRTSPQEHNIQWLPSIVIAYGGAVAALVVWRKSRPAWPLVFAGLFNFGLGILFTVAMIQLWGEKW